MKDATEPTTCTPLLTRAYWAIWVVGLLIWTYLLVVPTWLLPPWLRATAASSVGGFRVQKLGHSGVYALLTAYPFLLPVGRRHWKVTTAVMAAHGCATELIQTFVPTRSGELMDVAIDWFGVLIGLLIGPLLGRLCDWCLRFVGTAGGGPEGVAAAPEADRGAGREDAQADPL